MISIIPIFLPQESCPFNCIFCNQKKAVGEVERLSAEDIRSVVKNALKTIDEDSIVQIGFYGGSFTLLPNDQQASYLEAASLFIKEKRIASIRISTRPDSIDQKIISFLKSYGVSTVELGAEILDDNVLAVANRGHTVSDVINAVHLLKSNGIITGLQLMVGLPGENADKRRSSFNAVLDLKPDFLRIHPTIVLEGSDLADLYRKGIFLPLEHDDAVRICSDMVIEAESRGIPVIRIGLQSSCSLQEEGSIVAGPWHPSFGQMVRSEIYYKLLLKGIDFTSDKSCDSEIVVECADTETLKGQKNQNLKSFKKDFPRVNLKIQKDRGLSKTQLRMSCKGSKPYIVSIMDLIDKE